MSAPGEKSALVIVLGFAMWAFITAAAVDKFGWYHGAALTMLAFIFAVNMAEKS